MWFQPLENSISTYNSKPHKVKGFADDLTIIIDLPYQLRNTLTSKSLKEITNAKTDFELTLKPSKCISMVYNGKEMDKTMHLICSWRRLN